MSNGFLKIVMGPMYAGKTSFLINTIQNYDSNNILVVKHSFDTRYGDSDFIVSHDKKTSKCISVIQLAELFNSSILDNKDVIFIDEAQFFEDLYNTVVILVDELGKSVYLAGLDGDFKRCQFGNGDLLRLISMADEVIKINGTCAVPNCSAKSVFSLRTCTDDKQIIVGNCYIPVCRKHYLDN